MSPSPRPDTKRTQRTAKLALYLLLAALAAVPATAQAAPPDNDAFADAQVVHVGDRVTGTTIDATLQAGEPATDSFYTRSVWYRLTPSTSETLRIDTCSGAPWAEVAIFTGTGLGDLTEVAHTRQGCIGGSRLYMDAVAGTTYHVRAAGYDPGPGYTSGGDLVLVVARPQAPANDNFENAQPVGRPAQITGSTVDATVQPGEPEPAVYGGSGHSVWYKLAAATADVVVASTYESANAPIVAVYTGNGVGALTEVGTEGGPTGPRSTMFFSTRPGTTYYIAVRGHGDGADDFTLSITATSPPSPPSDQPGLPPAPTCPIQFATGLPTYSGTHSGGGLVCFSLTKDFSGIEWFHALDVPGDRCTVPWSVVAMMPRATPLVERRFGFANSFAHLTGSFPTNRGARGTFQASHAFGGQPLCTSATLTWTATTTATPPWVDVVAPSLRLGGATVQRPLRRSQALVVLVRCRGESCAASASAAVAGVRVTAAQRTVRPSTAGRSVRLALSARARRALSASLRTRRSMKVRVTVVARDGEGNPATARRTITLRR
jgi:hypothetical protein